MNRHRLAVLSVVLFAGVALAGCAVLGGARTAPVLGTWRYEMSNPAQGSFSGVMTLREEDDGYGGHLTVQEMSIDEEMVVESLETESGGFILEGRAAGYRFTMTGLVEGDTMTGENNVQGVGLFQLSGTRVEE